MLSSSLVSSLLVTNVLVNAENYIDGANNKKELHFLVPHPLAGQSASIDQNVKILSDGLGHYGKPPSGCLDDEEGFEVSGIPGMVRVKL